MWKSQLLQLNTKLNEDNLTALKDNLRNQLRRITCAQGLSCEGAVGVSWELSRSNSGHTVLLLVGSSFLPQHSVKLLCTGQNAKLSPVLKENKNLTKKKSQPPQPLLTCLTMPVTAHFFVFHIYVLYGPGQAETGHEPVWVLVQHLPRSAGMLRERPAAAWASPSLLISKFLMDKQGINLAAGPKPAVSSCVSGPSERQLSGNQGNALSP